MPARLTVAQLYDAFAAELELVWLSGEDIAQREITRDPDAAQQRRVLGPLNRNHPNHVQLLGPAEIRMFATPESLAADGFEYSLEEHCDVIIVTDSLTPGPALMERAAELRLPVIQSALPFVELRKQLRYLLTRRLAARRIIHGVMMDVNGTGILITGDASVGKSEVALELISRGHILVADDAPEFTRLAPGTLEGSCPPILQDFLEVRGLGVLNIARMYGDAFTRQRKILRFIVRLKAVGRGDAIQTQSRTADDPNQTLHLMEEERLREPDEVRTILGVRIPERTLPVAPGRNLAVLVEAAVRDYILRSRGYSATRDLIEKQAQAMRRP